MAQLITATIETAHDGGGWEPVLELAEAVKAADTVLGKCNDVRDSDRPGRYWVELSPAELEELDREGHVEVHGGAYRVVADLDDCEEVDL